MRWRLACIACVVCLSIGALADGAGDNIPTNVRPVPPPGVAVPAADRTELEAGISKLKSEIDSLRKELQGSGEHAAMGILPSPTYFDLLPDIVIFYNAARYALTYNEFFSPGEIGLAKQMLAIGFERAQQLRDRKPAWIRITGLVVKGYISKIDGSVQPYGLIVPVGYDFDNPRPHRLDFWFHGRGETLSELNFLNDRMHNRGEFVPPATFVLHPYGRYCCANKFAGEVDSFEALDNARRWYAIDEDRVSVRGFSMGGAACWQFATHFAGDWAAAAPGAGFAETPEFLKVYQNEPLKPTWYEQRLWHWYNSTDYALNLYNCPTVAYSGEKDSQKQAADMMTAALAAEGITLTHIIGPGARHFYEPRAKAEVARRIDAIMAIGRNPMPRRIRFTTWTLRYNRMLWLTVDGLGRHWERARVDAEIVDSETVRLRTANITALSIDMPPGRCPLDVTRTPHIILDGQVVAAPSPGSDRSWSVHFRQAAGKWAVALSPDDGAIRKRHGLQGPIDDAFMDRFIFVTPTGGSSNPKVAAWAASEQKHAITEWRRQFRGEPIVKTDRELTEDDIANSNLVLWGDCTSNRFLTRVGGILPIKWNGQGVHVGATTYDSEHCAPIMICPNPLNPKRYIVLNSGFTYREYDYLNNARQVPKLPDYAVVDVNTPPNAVSPGRIVAAGFFDELWRMPAK